MHVPPDVGILESTFAENEADPGPTLSPTAGNGGNWLFLGLDAQLAQVGGNIVTGGVGANGAQNCKASAGVIDDNPQGGNVEGPATGPFPSGPTNQCAFSQASDRHADPLLGMLANNGGPVIGDPTADQPTLTMALLAGSPAIDLVPSGVCSPVSFTGDERSFDRPSVSGTPCDSGAYEAQDSDFDGVPDDAPDNCRTTANANQANNDGDALGDLCDPDDDNDGFLDGADGCPTQAGTSGGCPAAPLIPPATTTPTLTPTFDLAGAIKKCKKKFPGKAHAKARKKCIRKAKARAGG
jgi:hypothetical protein